MNTATWKENDDVSGTRREETTNGKTVISKVPPPSSSSSSSSWIRSKDPRIVRVSRALGGKDRHSKVCTLRGLRDRRVRLSVPTAIQLYDLQERLGVDQPSKVVDWLLNAAKDEIDELPPLPISPENFTILNHHHHHRQSFLNLNPGLGPSQEPGQLGFKIGGDDSTTLANHKDEDEEHGLDGDNNEEGKQNEVVLGTNIHQLQHHHHHVESSHGSSFNLDDHHHHSGFQTDHHHHHQSNNLVPFPSQIFICPTMTQSLFPSPAEMIDPRQTVNQFQVPASSRNVSTLYSLIHNIRTPIQFDHVNNANANASNVSRIIGSESSTNG